MPVGERSNLTDLSLTLGMPVEYDLAMKPTNEPIMRRTAIFLRPDQTDELKVLSDWTGAPWAELIRRAIDLYIESRKDDITEAKKTHGRKR